MVGIFVNLKEKLPKIAVIRENSAVAEMIRLVKCIFTM